MTAVAFVPMVTVPVALLTKGNLFLAAIPNDVGVAMMSASGGAV